METPHQPMNTHTLNRPSLPFFTELGDIVHRIVELGVGHPGVEGKIDLPSSWTQKRLNRLTDQDSLKPSSQNRD